MPSNDARILRGAAIPTAVAGIIAMVISFAVAGGKGLLGALFGTLLVMAFFSFGQVALDRLTRSNPQIMMAAALLVYTTQILLVGIVLAVFKDTELFNRQAFAFTLLGCALIWTGFQVRGALKAKTFYVDTDASESKGDKPSDSGRQQ
jgi:ATP synthase protein I